MGKEVQLKKHNVLLIRLGFGTAVGLSALPLCEYKSLDFPRISLILFPSPHSYIISRHTGTTQVVLMFRHYVAVRSLGR